MVNAIYDQHLSPKDGRMAFTTKRLVGRWKPLSEWNAEDCEQFPKTRQRCVSSPYKAKVKTVRVYSADFHRFIWDFSTLSSIASLFI